MNYRIDLSHDVVMTAIQTGNLSHLLLQDQLLKEHQFNPRFSLKQFSEASITFCPTYKYDPGSSLYDTSEKQRIPAWCDRILWKSFISHHVKSLHYQRYEVDVSDHRPVSASFEVIIKSINSEVQSKLKVELQRQWVWEKRKLLEKARDFYSSYY